MGVVPYFAVNSKACTCSRREKLAHPLYTKFAGEST